MTPTRLIALAILALLIASPVLGDQPARPVYSLDGDVIHGAPVMPGKLK